MFLHSKILSLLFHVRDRAREKQRQKNLLRKKENESLKHKSERVKQVSDSADTMARKKTGRQRRATQTKEDNDELEKEYRLLKKLKRGAIDESEYEKLMGLGNFSEENNLSEDEGDIPSVKNTMGHKKTLKFKRGKGRKHEGKQSKIGFKKRNVRARK